MLKNGVGVLFGDFFTSIVIPLFAFTRDRGNGCGNGCGDVRRDGFGGSLPDDPESRLLITSVWLGGRRILRRGTCFTWLFSETSLPGEAASETLAEV
jgi:hypothetical protein